MKEYQSQVEKVSMKNTICHQERDSAWLVSSIKAIKAWLPQAVIVAREVAKRHKLIEGTSV
jgi:hypothetical protein